MRPEKDNFRRKNRDTRETFRREIESAGLVIAEMGDTSWDDTPFAMYAIVKRG